MPNEEHISKMREAAAIASTVIYHTGQYVKPGVTLNQLDKVAAELIKQLHAEPFNLNYKPAWAKTPYPAVLCTSVNNEIAHGIPNDYVLEEGDTINIDVGIKFNGVCGDCALTLPVGEISKKNERLLRYARRACYKGIEVIKAGVLVVEIAKAVESYVMKLGYVTNQVFSGHDIGEEMHGKGLIIPFFTSFQPQYVQRFAGEKLEAGQVVCIEPMITKKDRTGRMKGDGWTLETRDKKNSAMFEHMVLVKEDGYEILTDHFNKE